MRRRALRTLARPVELAGIGLHTGRHARVRLLPAPAGDGVYFVRSDLPCGSGVEVRLPASPTAVVETKLCTTLGAPGRAPAHTIATVEHLLAALCGMDVHACRIEVDAPELPLLDGSAAPWVRAIRAAGTIQHCAPSTRRRLAAPVAVGEDDSWVVAVPAASLRLTCGIDFPRHAPIGRQWFSWAPDEEGGGRGRVGGGGGGQQSDKAFDAQIAPARTFALAEQIDALRAGGLIRGGSLENALVCDRDRWLNGPLRFPDEPARHKLLDLLGDLALLGRLPAAHVVAYKGSHRLHVRLAAALAERLQQGEGEPS